MRLLYFSFFDLFFFKQTDNFTSFYKVFSSLILFTFFIFIQKFATTGMKSVKFARQYYE
jgi:hypothetical protein